MPSGSPAIVPRSFHCGGDDDDGDCVSHTCNFALVSNWPKINTCNVALVSELAYMSRSESKFITTTTCDTNQFKRAKIAKSQERRKLVHKLI